MKWLEDRGFSHVYHIGTGRLRDCLKEDYWGVEDESGRRLMALDVDANKFGVYARVEDDAEVFRMVWDAGSTVAGTVAGTPYGSIVSGRPVNS